MGKDRSELQNKQ